MIIEQLFPLGPRQRAALARIAPDQPPEAAHLGLLRGVASGLREVAIAAGASGRVLDWLLLRDGGPAADLLWAQAATPVALAADELGGGYAAVVPAELRHPLGEHYTPWWLVLRIISELWSESDATDCAGAGIVADPSCGDGRFLVALLERGHDPATLWGLDLNPLAVMMARINVWRALSCPRAIPPVRVEWGDFLAALAEAPAPALPAPHAYVGNPPWVTWRNLSGGYRTALAGRLAGSRLHHTRGWAARVSAGQADLAHVFLHDAVERVAPGGRLAFVLPRSVFKAPVGPARLREGFSTAGRPYRFTRVLDCGAPAEFGGVRADTVVAYIDVDAAPRFPVPWQPAAGGAALAAVPCDPDDLSSPWATGPRPRLAAGSRWSDLRARGGINTGGGNGVFHVSVVSTSDGHAVVRNSPPPRSGLAAVTATIETTFLRPLLRGRDIAAWRAAPSGHIIVPHDLADLRRPATVLPPLTHAYLAQFKATLAGRKEVRRWASCWYELFRIGPYTADRWRVVWPHSANGRLRAAILAPDDPTVPDQKVVLVAFDEEDPALFLCALLNSSLVAAEAAASGGLDASPNLMRRLVLPRYRADAHRSIVELAAVARAGDPAAPAARSALDAAVEALFVRSSAHP